MSSVGGTAMRGNSPNHRLSSIITCKGQKVCFTYKKIFVTGYVLAAVHPSIGPVQFGGRG